MSPVSSISIACLRETLRESATIGVLQNSPIFTPGVAKRASVAATAAPASASNGQQGPSGGASSKRMSRAERDALAGDLSPVTRMNLAIALHMLGQRRNDLGLYDEAAAAYAEALKTISEGDAQDDIDTLYSEAKRTQTPTDDMIVRRIGGLDERLATLERETSELRRSARELIDRRAEVEGVRDRFRRSGFDHPNATFRNDSEIAVVLDDESLLYEGPTNALDVSLIFQQRL